MNVSFVGVTKRYGAVVACDNVDLTLRSGEVTAILGENGAGKSTLMKILCGVVTPDSGEIRLDGKPVRIDSPRASRALQIGMVFQQFSSIAAFTVEENMILGAPKLPLLFLGKSEVRTRAREVLAAMAPGVDPGRRVGDLAVGEKQLVEIAKVLARGAEIVILDEPSSVLAELETRELWVRLRQLASEGRTVVFVTHKLSDVRAAADRVVVLRAGKVTLDTTNTTDTAALLRATVGELPDPRERRSSPGGTPRLAVRGVALAAGDSRIADLNLDVAAGEILGVAGVTGNGQELLGRLLAGVARPSSGTILLGGESVRADMAGSKIGYVPEQPLLNGVAPELSVLENLTAIDTRRLPLWLDLSPFRSAAKELVERFDVRPRDLDRPAGTLSGGNVQKLVAARELGGAPLLVVACFPTMGLDAAAARLLSNALVELADRGAAVVWISEDLDALLVHADRIGVLYRGRLRGPIAARDATAVGLGAWMTGEAA